MANCKNCKIDFKPHRNSFGIYCSNECQHDFLFKEQIKEIEKGKIFSHKIMKKYLIKKLGNQCQNLSCGWDWSKPCPVELEHKDGNGDNNSLENLTLLCPNCHSMTPTYKNKNKGNGRHLRRQRYKEGKSY